ncbi:hypothetical protein FEM48_Zijuj08G0060700 [Ziziphus jujuba var. spinosa]|uniref:3-hydroxyisobutyryl-CoA hydrolase n=1 Tax=Ziziphus jujuba var. spinosa TaxID=714518 RepID=A0A978UXE5_ZIZJJ|nr:hypothetical protein FEM48_Zijuj08G0060700 [Ziziphus jujuba var. spinosa]
MLQRLRAASLKRQSFHSSRLRGLCTLAQTATNDDLDNQAARLQKLYKSWEDNPDIGFVAMKGSGRAFCAGGDIVSLYHLINRGNLEDCKQFFRTAYTLVYIIGTYLKPHVALLNGIAMGGGAGVSIPGTFRVATDKTVMILLLLKLGNLVTDDPSIIETSLEKCGEVVYPEQNSVLQSRDTVEEIIDALEIEAARTNDAWCTSTLKRLREVSPLSLKVALKSGISKQISNDFCEGVRARVVDKDLAPKWDPPTLEQVSEDMVDRYFCRLSEFKPDLDLPTSLREAFN